MAALTESKSVPCPYTAGGCPLFQTVTPVTSTTSSCSTSCSPPSQQPSNSISNNSSSNPASSTSMAAWGPYLEFDITPGLSNNESISSIDTPAYYASLQAPAADNVNVSAPPPVSQDLRNASHNNNDSKRQLRDIEELLPMPKRVKADSPPHVQRTYVPSPADSTSASPNSGADDGGESTEDDKPSTPFISKLVYLLTHQNEYRRFVQWDSTGRYIILAHADPNTLSMLTKFFRHTTIASFVRQLNIYGFKRLSTTELLDTLEQSLSTQTFAASDYCAFYHNEFFKPSPGHPCRVGKLKPIHKDKNKPKTKKTKMDSDDSASP
ncbi:hypothetical protein OIO90_002232 [Microbotryomycetes sp. JL221]|nr:hypothetical protein OIO90_002232 [Microbotryomycetes sp. JL221]